MLLHNRFYAFFLLFLATCAGWLLIILSGITGPDFTICLFKNLTGISCPACGSSRAVEHLLHGEFLLAITTNPVGLFSALAIGGGAFLFLVDLTKGTTFLEQVAHRINNRLKQPVVFGLLVTLMLSNWIWNITKGI